MARSFGCTILMACCILGGFGCGKKDDARKADSFAKSTSPPSGDMFKGIEPPWLHRTLPSAAPIAEAPPRGPADPITCPKAEGWSKIDEFAPACGYAWTHEAAKLPPALEWGSCDPSAGIRPAACKQLQRSGRLKKIAAGLTGDGTVQIGFVEECQRDQIVLANVDGPTRFALRATGAPASDAACEVNLLAVDMGKWLAALGTEQIETRSLGHSFGGAILGANVGEQPSLLHSTSKRFHVSTTQGFIVPEGWMVGGKRQYWNGKPFESPVHPNWYRLTKQLFVDEDHGIYLGPGPDSKMLLPAGQGRQFVHFARRDKQIVWREIHKDRGLETCHLVAGEVDKHHVLTKARRLTEIPCDSSRHVIGCNFALLGNARELLLVSLANGSRRYLLTKGNVLAIGCKEAFVEQRKTLLRIALSAFLPEKAPTEPPESLSLQSVTTDVDAGAPDATTDGRMEADAQP